MTLYEDRPGAIYRNCRAYKEILYQRVSPIKLVQDVLAFDI